MGCAMKFVLLGILLLWSPGCTDSDQISEAKQAIDGVETREEKDHLQSPGAGQTQQFSIKQIRAIVKENRYEVGVRLYLQQDLAGQSDLLFERGRFLLEAAEFYASLGDYALELQTDLLAIWEEQRDLGWMEIDSLPYWKVLNAYARGNYAECIAASGDVGGGDVSVALARRAQWAVAMSRMKLGQRDQGEQLLRGLEELGEEDYGLGLLLYRSMAENERPGVNSGDGPAWDIDQIKEKGYRNAAILDLARLALRRGDVDRAYMFMLDHKPGLPLLEEEFRDRKTDRSDGATDIGQVQEEVLTRKHYGIDFLKLYAEIHYALARRDLSTASAAKSDLGMYSKYLLGRTLLNEGRYEAAIAAFDAFSAESEELFGEVEYFAYVRDLVQAYRGSALLHLGRVKEAEVCWGSIRAGEELSGVSVRATIMAERLVHKGRIRADVLNVDTTAIDSIGGIERLRTEDERDYYTNACLQTAQSLFGIEGEEYRAKVLDILKDLHQGSDGYNPNHVEPKNLLALSRAYFRFSPVEWSLGKTILGSMLEDHRVCVPVVEVFSYLQSDIKGSDWVVPGSGQAN
jgi:hypothetical protein